MIIDKFQEVKQEESYDEFWTWVSNASSFDPGEYKDELIEFNKKVVNDQK